MSEEKKELKKNLKNEELCEGKQKLSIEDLENVTGGIMASVRKVESEEVQVPKRDEDR